MARAADDSAIHHFCDEAAAHDGFDPLLVNQLLCLELGKSPASLRNLFEDLWVLVAKLGHIHLGIWLADRFAAGQNLVDQDWCFLSKHLRRYDIALRAVGSGRILPGNFLGCLEVAVGIKTVEHSRRESRGVGHLQVVDDFLRFFWRHYEVLERSVHAVNAFQAELHSRWRDAPPFLALDSHEKSHVLDHIEINFGIFYSDSFVPEELTKGLAA
jgi:hypothetical protein